MGRNHRGATLVELVVAIALLTLLAAAALRSMLTLGRQSVAVAEHSAVQAGVRTGMLIARAELRELGGDDAGPDLTKLSADSLTFRAARGFGMTCAVTASQVRIRDAPPLPFSRLRAIAPGRDSLLLFVEGDALTPLDDRWVRLPILSVGSSSCAGVAALAVGTVDLTGVLGAGGLASIEVGGPVRTFEVMRLAEYASAGARWIGLASVSGGETIQPLAGPLGGDGLTLEYFDGGGARVTDPAAVQSIRVTIVGMGERAVPQVWAGGPGRFAAETVSTRLALRNVRR